MNYKNMADKSALFVVAQHTINFAYGTISAFRDEKSLAENRTNNAIMKNIFQRKGYEVLDIMGQYIENYNSPDAKMISEESFFIADVNNSGRLKNIMSNLALVYDQDSILYGEAGKPAYLIGTSKRANAYPSYNENVKQGMIQPNKKGEFYSTINGQPFTFA